EFVFSSRRHHTLFSRDWSSDVCSSDLAKRPVFTDAENGVGWNLSVSYHPGLRRYLLCTQHTAIAEGNLGIFDAPEPWGPWTTVRSEERRVGTGGSCTGSLRVVREAADE